MGKITVGQVNRKCFNPNEVPDGNLFYNGLNLLDNNESWQSYIKTQHSKFFNEDEWKDFQKVVITQDAFGGYKYIEQMRGIMQGYVPYLKDTGFIKTIDGKQQGLFSEYGEQQFNQYMSIKLYNIEHNIELFLSMFEDGNTHRTILGKTKGPFLDRILTDKQYAERVFGASIDEITYHNFSLLYDRKSIGEFLPKGAKELLGKQTYLLYDENGKKLEDPVIGQLTNNYLSKLSIKKQLEQIEFSLGRSLGTFEKFGYVLKKSIFGINNIVYKVFKGITAPWIYSTLLSIGGGLSGFSALIILNSAMYFSDLIQHKKIIKGDWDSFFKKIGIDDGLSRVDYFGISFTTGLKHICGVFKELLNSGLFNLADKLADTSYKRRVVQEYLMQLFPGVTDLNVIENLLDDMKKTRPDQYNKLLTAIYNLIGLSEQKQRGTQNIMSTRAKTSMGPFSPLREIGNLLYNFFANWGRGKSRGALKIIRDCFDGKHFKGFAKYIDDMYAEGKGVDYILGEYNRIQFDLSELQYFVEKIALTFLISKYCVRIMGDEDNESATFFSGFNEYLDYIKVFEGNIAAIETLPEFKIINSLVGTMEKESKLGASGFDLAATTSMNTTKTILNILTRGLFLPRMTTEVISKINRDRKKEEKHWLSYIWSSIEDNCAGFKYYLESTIDDGLTEYYFPAGPKRILKEFFGIQNEEIAYINDEKNSLKLLKAVNSKENFSNWVLYNFPFLKQRNMGQFNDYEKDFIVAVNDFKDSKAYHEFINNRFPIDMQDEDWIFTYNTITKRIQNKKGAIQDNIYTLYQYTDKKTEEIKTSRDLQLQENIIDHCMRYGLTKEQIAEFQKQLKSSNKAYNDEAIKTLAYLEANESGAGLQALAYIMQREVFKETYKGTDKDTLDEVIKEKRKQAEIDVTKKYAKYVLQVDKQRSLSQIILNYAKTHGYHIGNYIEATDPTGFKNVRLVTSEGKGSTVFDDTFKAQLVTDVMAAAGNINAYKVKNAYGKIYDITNIYDDNGKIDLTMAKYMLTSLNAVYDHIDHLAISEEEERVLKQGALMFNEQFIDYLIHNDAAMSDEGIKTAVNDWLHYWYKEFDELNELAEKYAEEQLEEKTFKIYLPKHWNNNYKRYNKGGYNKYKGQGYYRGRYNYYKNRGLDNWYNTMKSKAYGDRFNYKVYDWKPTNYNVDYLSETDYAKIREVMRNLRTAVGTSGGSKSGGSRGSNGDNGIGVSTKRGKAFQFYKMEDPNKPVEYNRPWRARFVKKGKGYEPIKTTTWKMLQK